MADYWLAPSLEQFRAEINALYPDRDKRSDGWIGDKYHAGGKSDHNPSQWPPAWKGVVRAFDVDNDLAVGKNAQSLATYLAGLLGRHPALMSGAYLIYNGRIISTDRLREGWRKYSGKNPHTGHIHISVSSSPAGYNSRASWGLNGATPPGTSTPKINEEIDMNTVLWVERGAIFTLGPQFIKHETNGYAAEVVANVFGRRQGDGKIVRTGDTEFGALVTALGVPWYAVQATLDGNAYLIDGRLASAVEGQAGQGKFWSREMEIAQAVRDAQGVDPAVVSSVLKTAADEVFKNLSDNMAEKITGDFTGTLTFENKE